MTASPPVRLKAAAAGFAALGMVENAAELARQAATARAEGRAKAALFTIWADSAERHLATARHNPRGYK